MSRGRWLAAGFGIGLGAVAAVALLLWFPRTRRFVRSASEEWLGRMTDAVREGVRAARTREAELEHEFAAERAMFASERPDYII